MLTEDCGFLAPAWLPALLPFHSTLLLEIWLNWTHRLFPSGFFLFTSLHFFFLFSLNLKVLYFCFYFWLSHTLPWIFVIYIITLAFQQNRRFPKDRDWDQALRSPSDCLNAFIVNKTVEVSRSIPNFFFFFWSDTIFFLLIVPRVVWGCFYTCEFLSPTVLTPWPPTE